MTPTDYLAIVILGLGGLAALVVGFSWLFARHWCKPKRRPPSKTPADYDVPFAPITFASHRTTLNGWFIPANGNPAPHPTVIVAHGWSTNATQMLPVARLLHSAGFGVLMYNARGHGTSGDDGPITLLKFAQDLRAAVDYLEEQPDADLTRLGVVGHSMGGAGAIVAASTDPRIRAVISSSAFADPESLTQDYMGKLHIPRWPFPWLVCRIIERWASTTMTDLAPKNRIGRIRAPVLLIHGDSDRFVPPSNVDILYTQADQERTQKWLAPGRRHSDVILDPHYGSRVIQFLNEHLSFGKQRIDQEE